MKLVMATRTNVNGRTLEAGEHIDVADPSQISSMLESRVAVPANTDARELWRQSRLQLARSWVRRW